MKNNQLFTELNSKESASVNGGLSFRPLLPPWFPKLPVWPIRRFF